MSIVSFDAYSKRHKRLKQLEKIVVIVKELFALQQAQATPFLIQAKIKELREAVFVLDTMN